MYKIEGEDLYLIGTSVLSMIANSLTASPMKQSSLLLIPATPLASVKKSELMALRNVGCTGCINLRSKR
jgi:hypothetical protein